VFFHIPKVAGLYIDNLLNNEEDFVTYNFIDNSDIAFYSDIEKGIRQEFWDHCKKFNISENILYNSYEFTFVRNPYTKFISAYFYCKGKEFEKLNNIFGEDIISSLQKCIDSKEMLTNISYFHIFKTQQQHIECSNDNKIDKKMDFIGKFENLIPDLQKVYNRLNFKTKISTKKINENPISYGDFRQYYTQEILDFVNDWFNIDFVNFGYCKVYKVENLK
jgi:hypothetical protein